MIKRILSLTFFIACLFCNINLAFADLQVKGGLVQDQEVNDREFLEKRINEDELPPVFGTQLFSGNFAKENFTGFNPDYQIAIGDKIILQMWGAFHLNDSLIVDPKGNIFVPEVGPINVAGIKNSELNEIIKIKIKSIFEKNVGVYASLETMQPVKVFVTGYVTNPGLYDGLSSDSVISFIDKAKGIDFNRGSFLNIKVMRNNELLKTVNLYDFIVNGVTNYIQFRDGDTVIIGPALNRIAVSGSIDNAFQFEFMQEPISGEDLLKLARPLPKSTHAKIIRTSGTNKKSFYMPLADFKQSSLFSGDVVEIVSDKRKANIFIQIEGEHIGNKEYVMPYNATLDQLIAKLEFNDRSLSKSIQLYRKSIAARQKEMLHASLDNLEKKMLSSHSVNLEAAELKNKESQLLEKFIAKARNIQPKGQIILPKDYDYAKIYLEDNDIIRIPAKNNLVITHGEILFPTALVFNEKKKVRDYIDLSGGFTSNADDSNILILNSDGVMRKASLSDKIEAGDEILIMAKVDLQIFQVVKDVAQILYQIALTTKVVTSI